METGVFVAIDRAHAATPLHRGGDGSHSMTALCSHVPNKEQF
jgi:hypothetical protein